MQRSFETLMTAKSDEELDNYLVNIQKYTPEAIHAAVVELQKRGREFSEVELENIRIAIEDKQKVEKREEVNLFTNKWKKHIVTDSDAPAYFSHRAIWGFSLFFTVIFGAVLLASNLKGNNKARFIVIGFGILYTALSVVLLAQISRNTGLTIAVNGVGGWIMTSFFWDKYLGQDTKYRTKPIWKPLIISIVITIPFLLAVIYGPKI